MQIRIDMNGRNYVVITPSEDFPPEADPQNDDNIDMIKDMVVGRNLLPRNNMRIPNDTVERRTNTAAKTVIGVMLLWTRKSECLYAKPEDGANCNVDETSRLRMADLLMELAVEETNTAYQLSGVNIQLDLVHSYRSDYVEPSTNAFDTSLRSLRLSNDGVMDEVHQLRVTYGADVVALIIDDPAYCGIGKYNPVFLIVPRRMHCWDHIPASSMLIHHYFLNVCCPIL